MSSNTPSRRTIVRTAAWSVPAVTLATAAPAFATSPIPGDPTAPEYQTLTKVFSYDARLGGPTGGVLGQIAVEVTATVPLIAPQGATLNPTQTVSKVTIPANLADLLKSLYLPGATQVDGTSVSASELTGVVNTTVTSNLTIPMTPLPAAGQPMVTTASGQSAGGLVIPGNNPTGLVTITMGEPASVLVGYRADGTPTGGEYVSNLYKRVGTTDADYLLANFNVVA